MNFSRSGHPIFRASSAFERGELKSKGHDKKSIHFNGSDENIELLLRTVISANQLSVYGAIADLCRELSEDSRASEKPEAHDHMETMDIPTEPSIADPHTDEKRQGETWCKTVSADSNKCPTTRRYPNKGLKTVEIGQYFFTLDTEEGPHDMEHLCRECTMPRNEKKTRAEGWILKNTRIGPVLDITICFHQDRYSIEIMVESLFPDRTASWVRTVNGIRHVCDRIDGNQGGGRA